MPSKLTAAFLKSLKSPTRGRIETRDSLVSGLSIRITEKGAMSWAVKYRQRGRQRRLTLGRYPDVNLATARELARSTLDQVARGHDPAAEKRANRHKPDPAPVPTVAELCDRFIELYARPKNRSWRETQRVLRTRIVGRFGRRSADSLSRREFDALLDEIGQEGSPYMANRVLAATRKLFNWAVEREILEVSPVAKIRPPAQELARDRELSDKELNAVLDCAVGMGWPFGQVFRLMAITGQRRSEVAGMRWQDIDLDRRSWVLPREMTKSNRRHEVPLSDLALEVLRANPGRGDMLFSTTGRKPISGFSKAKRRCDELSGVTDWRLHDLRRTVASGMARLGVDPHIVEKVLNHSTGTISGVAAVYNRHGYLEEKRDALRSWAEHVKTLIDSSGRRPNVVALQGGRPG